MCMTTVTVSPKFQVVIPKQVRSAMNLKSGIKMEVISYADRIEFIPIKPIHLLRGIVSGIDTVIIRGKDRL